MKKAIIILILLLTILVACSNGVEPEGEPIHSDNITEPFYGVEFYGRYVYTTDYEIKTGLLYMHSYYEKVGEDEYVLVERGKVISDFIIERLKEKN